jgi:hypothetical protein
MHTHGTQSRRVFRFRTARPVLKASLPLAQCSHRRKQRQGRRSAGAAPFNSVDPARCRVRKVRPPAVRKVRAFAFFGAGCARRLLDAGSVPLPRGAHSFLRRGGAPSTRCGAGCSLTFWGVRGQTLPRRAVETLRARVLQHYPGTVRARWDKRRPYHVLTGCTKGGNVSLALRSEAHTGVAFGAAGLWFYGSI